MLFASIVQLSYAQYQNPFPKSLTYFNTHSLYLIELPNKAKLFIASPNFKSLEYNKDLDSLLNLFVQDYQKLRPALEESTQARTATFKANKNGKHLIDLKTHTNKTDEYAFGKTLMPLAVKTQQDTLIIKKAGFRISTDRDPSFFENDGAIAFVYFYLVVNNLEDVADIMKSGGVNTKIEQTMMEVKNQKTHTDFANRLQFYYANKGRPQYATAPDSTHKFWNMHTPSSPFIAFHGGIGLGYLGNQWSLNNYIYASLVPSKFKSMGYGLGFRSIHTSTNDVNGGFKTSSSNFVYTGITFYDFKKGKALSEVNSEHILAGFYLGRMVHNGTPLFKANTWSFHSTISLKGLVKIEPEVFFEGFLKNPTPGLRLVVGL